MTDTPTRVECNPTDHNFTHAVINYGPYNKLKKLLIYCTKCGTVSYEESL